jgi:hypothetical protein
MTEHLTYVSIRKETNGDLLGTPTCEVCGPLDEAQYLPDHETDLEQIADLHWLRASSGASTNRRGTAER